MYAFELELKWCWNDIAPGNNNFHWSRLCVTTVLQGRTDDLLVHLGMKCSSWSRVNIGTSMRAICCPAGDLTKLSVKQANCMAARIPIFQFRGLVWINYSITTCRISIIAKKIGLQRWYAWDSTWLYPSLQGYLSMLQDYPHHPLSFFLWSDVAVGATIPDYAPLLWPLPASHECF